MEDAVQVAKWGKSLAVRLPAVVVEAFRGRLPADFKFDRDEANAQ